MKAVILGASGAVGKELLAQILADDDFKEVVAFSRRDLGLEHDKLKVHKVNFDSPDSWADLIKADVAFISFGTTLKQAKSQKEMRKVDLEYTLNFAKAAKQNNIPKLILLSSLGANIKSKNFYLSLKAEIENEIKKLNFQLLGILRPSLLLRPNSDRFKENIAKIILNILNFIALARQYRPMPIKLLASVMISLSKRTSGPYELENSEILRYFNKKQY